MGKLASRVDTKYGEENLKNFARETEIPFETLKRYRSVWRAWEKRPRVPVRYSVARALARIPDKERVFDRLVDKRESEGAVTEEAAIKAAKEYRKERSAGKYADFVLHRIVSLICRRLGSIAREDSELTHAINDYLQYKHTDLEYFRKVADAIDDASKRLSTLREKVSRGFFDEAEAQLKAMEPEGAEDMGTVATPFRKGEGDEG